VVCAANVSAELSGRRSRDHNAAQVRHGNGGAWQSGQATGKFTFEDINALQASDQNARALIPLAKSDLPPVTVGMLTALESLFRQSAGAMGNGMKLFVFDGAGIDSCSKGRLSIPLADETYTWDTPFPSCQQN
jgi:hypothetical protein